MNKQSRESLDAYYFEADSWANDRRDALLSSRKVAWLVAAAAVVVATLEAFALLLLTPLKTVEPYTLLVDRNTGFVQALAPLDPQRISGDKALTQSFLVQYVIGREGYDANSIQDRYRRVALWSNEGARSSYVAAMQASSPDSPLVRYPRSTVIETLVKSVSPLSDNVAMVRFETRRRDAGGQAQPPQAWVATIRYRFSGEPMRLEDRMINPLGFQVLRYRRDAEALPVEAAPTALPEPVVIRRARTPAPPRAQPQRPPQPPVEL
ncbi:virB8 family protein [Sphingomonas sp. SUN039]|uniref:virB8 family protein n=1 Tax=Sphingomonas sp. SUN039 TaxID=2937787 RepID=UPI00216420C1|nr:VirB8/TrbF family protein [Sphingomonas sp. SUN039]UVO52823.1 VirB8/TrbF family protein [Sphingomonas sp. SUN039]